jgi:hypothetical protein
VTTCALRLVVRHALRGIVVGLKHGLEVAARLEQIRLAPEVWRIRRRLAVKATALALRLALVGTLFALDLALDLALLQLLLKIGLDGTGNALQLAVAVSEGESE